MKPNNKMNHDDQTHNRANSEPDWAELTHELLTNIISRLTLEDRWTGPIFVSKSWFRATTDPILNSVFDLETRFDSVMTELAQWWVPEFERKVDNMVRCVVRWSEGGITEIRVRHCSDRAVSLVARSCPNLKVLSIKSCANVTDESIAQISTECPKLREIDLSYCYEISHKSLALLGNNCPDIKILKRNFMNWLDPSQHTGIVPKEYLNACPQDADSEANAIGKYFPNIVHLELRFSKLSAKGLALISQGCLNLEYLDLYGCANVTSRDIANACLILKNLKEIKKPNFYIPRSVYHTERYGHWNLYDERFQTDVFRI